MVVDGQRHGAVGTQHDAACIEIGHRVGHGVRQRVWQRGPAAPQHPRHDGHGVTGDVGRSGEQAAQQRPTLEQRSGGAVMATHDHEPIAAIAPHDREPVRLLVPIGGGDRGERPAVAEVVLHVLPQHVPL
jgi:hypothetical protein